MSLSVESGVCWRGVCLVYLGLGEVCGGTLPRAPFARRWCMTEVLAAWIEYAFATHTNSRLTALQHNYTGTVIEPSSQRRRCPITLAKRTNSKQAASSSSCSSISAAAIPTLYAHTTTQRTNPLVSQHGNPAPLPRGQGPVHPPLSFHCPSRH